MGAPPGRAVPITRAVSGEWITIQYLRDAVGM
ncbi:hypothetical protein J2S53_001704 [Actinopolyspora lacussalsi]|nr:hypothetical protein [Actinopolyspora lacussalsi]